jgi:hypothetical protein
MSSSIPETQTILTTPNTELVQQWINAMNTNREEEIQQAIRDKKLLPRNLNAMIYLFKALTDHSPKIDPVINLITTLHPHFSERLKSLRAQNRLYQELERHMEEARRQQYLVEKRMTEDLKQYFFDAGFREVLTDFYNGPRPFEDQDPNPNGWGTVGDMDTPLASQFWPGQAPWDPPNFLPTEWSPKPLPVRLSTPPPEFSDPEAGEDFFEISSIPPDQPGGSAENPIEIEVHTITVITDDPVPPRLPVLTPAQQKGKSKKNKGKKKQILLSTGLASQIGTRTTPPGEEPLPPTVPFRPPASQMKPCYECRSEDHTKIQCPQYVCPHCRARAPGHFARNCWWKPNTSHTYFNNYDDNYDSWMTIDMDHNLSGEC